MENTDRAKTVQKPCTHGLQNKKAMKSFDFTAFSGAMEGTRTPGLLIRSQSLYPAELPTHTFRSEQDVFYHSIIVLSTPFCNYFYSFWPRSLFTRVHGIFYRLLFASISALSARRLHSRAPFRYFCSVLLISSYIGILRQTLCARRVCAFFPAKSRSKRKPSIFYDFSCIAFVILVL